VTVALPRVCPACQMHTVQIAGACAWCAKLARLAGPPYQRCDEVTHRRMVKKDWDNLRHMPGVSPFIVGNGHAVERRQCPLCSQLVEKRL